MTLLKSEQIVNAVHTGEDPAFLNSISAGETIAAGNTVANISDASTAHALNSTFSDTEVEAALNALGTKINSIIAALEEFKISTP